jgi:hypothetical protein
MENGSNTRRPFFKTHKNKLSMKRFPNKYSLKVSFPGFELFDSSYEWGCVGGRSRFLKTLEKKIIQTHLDLLRNFELFDSWFEVWDDLGSHIFGFITS